MNAAASIPVAESLVPWHGPAAAMKQLLHMALDALASRFRSIFPEVARKCWAWLCGGLTMNPRTIACLIVTVVLTALLNPVSLSAQGTQQPKPGSETRHHRYTLVDMGTFGGPDSYFIFGVGLNGRGSGSYPYP
jgi:hypothetical protein